MNYNILFLGQRPLAEKCFSYLMNLNDERFSIKGVVSNMSRDVWWGSNGIYELTMEKNIQFLDSAKKSEKDILDIINKQNINLIISIQHSWILSKDILRSVDYLAFNLHSAKLPEYKGNFTMNHSILNKEKEYTCTLHLMADEVDMGDICYESSFPIEEDDTAKSLFEKSYIHGQRIFYSFVKDLMAGISPPRRKILSKGTFYSRSSIKSLKEIKNINNSEEIKLKSRAFYFPYFDKAYFILDSKKYFVIPDYEDGEIFNLEDVI